MSAGPASNAPVAATVDATTAAAVTGRPAAEVLRSVATSLRRRWLPELVLRGRRLGAAGLAGIVLLATALLLQVSTRAPLQDEVASLADVVARAPARGAAQASTARAPDVASLPPRGDLPALLGVVFEEAARAGVALDSGRYEALAMPASHVVRYRIALPLHGEYPRVRAFVGAVLARLPNAAVSGLDVERKSVAESAVDADLRLSLFVRDAP